MRQNVSKRFNDRCTIQRRTKTGETATNEPIHGSETVVAGEPCQYLPSSTTFTREDTGENVQRPARLRVAAGVDVQEGDRVTIDGIDTQFEVRGIEPMRDSRTAREIAQRCELERVE